MWWLLTWMMMMWHDVMRADVDDVNDDDVIVMADNWECDGGWGSSLVIMMMRWWQITMVVLVMWMMTSYDRGWWGSVPSSFLENDPMHYLILFVLLSHLSLAYFFYSCMDAHAFEWCLHSFILEHICCPMLLIPCPFGQFTQSMYILLPKPMYIIREINVF